MEIQENQSITLFTILKVIAYVLFKIIKWVFIICIGLFIFLFALINACAKGR